MANSTPNVLETTTMPNPRRSLLRFDHLEHRSLLAGSLSPVQNLFTLTSKVIDTTPVASTVAPVLAAVENVTASLTPVTNFVGYFTSPAAPALNLIDQIITEDVSPVIETVVVPVVTPIVNVIEPVVAPVFSAIDPIVAPITPGGEPIVTPIISVIDPVVTPVVSGVNPITQPVNVLPTPASSLPITPISSTTTPTSPAQNPVASTPTNQTTVNDPEATVGTPDIAAPNAFVPPTVDSETNPIIAITPPTISAPTEVTVREDTNAATFLVIESQVTTDRDISASITTTDAGSSPAAFDFSTEGDLVDETNLHPMGLIDQAMIDGVERLEGFVDEAMAQVSTWNESAGLLPWLSALAVAGVVYEVARRDLDRKHRGKVATHVGTTGLSPYEIK